MEAVVQTLLQNSHTII